MAKRAAYRADVPVEVVVEHAAQGTVTPYEFRVYYADGSYDLYSYRTRNTVEENLTEWLEAEGFDSDTVTPKLPRGTGDWEFSIKLKYT